LNYFDVCGWMSLMDFEPTLLPGIVFSDHVIEDRMTGKRSLIGIFNDFTLPRLPTTVLPYWATCWITNLHGDIEAIQGACRIEHPDSGHVIDSTGVQITVRGGLDRGHVVAMPMPFDATTFKTAGVYAAVMLIDGEEIGRRAFAVHIRKMPSKSDA
jgi:hypothetical protein